MCGEITPWGVDPLLLRILSLEYSNIGAYIDIPTAPDSGNGSGRYHLPFFFQGDSDDKGIGAGRDPGWFGLFIRIYKKTR